MSKELMERIKGMDEGELADFLIDECGADDTINDFDQMSKTELIDHIVDCYLPELIELHSKFQDGESSIMHPDETVEEFMEHEDHDLRDPSE